MYSTPEEHSRVSSRKSVMESLPFYVLYPVFLTLECRKVNILTEYFKTENYDLFCFQLLQF